VAFFLLVLVNAALFIRPSEIIPDLEAIPIYNLLISSCFLLAFPAVQRELTRRSLVETPISVCVLGLLPAVVLSHLSHFQRGYAQDAGISFLKVLVYYLLIVAVLDSPGRLSRFLNWLAVMIGVVTLLALLHYHGIMTVAHMNVMERDDVDPATGQIITVLQLFGTGIFADPNDLCLMLTIGIGLSLYRIGDRRSALRGLWLVALVGFAYALYLTRSRGGFLAMLGCIVTYCLARFGWKKAIPVTVLVVPLMFVLFAGRSTNLNTSSGTGQGRIQYWGMAVPWFRGSPVFGIGAGMLPDAIGKEAHNSYVSGYAELGFVGGTLFLGVYAATFWGLFQLGRFEDQIQDPELRRIRPYLLAMAGGYAVGMLSLTRNYINPTYLIPGLAAAYLRLAAADARVPVPLPRCDGWHVKRLVVLSAASLLAIYGYIRLFARFG